MPESEADVLRRTVMSECPEGNLLLTNPHEWPDPPADQDHRFQMGWWAALRMVATTSTAGLNEFEHAIAGKVAELAADFIELVGDTDTASEDFAEILPHLHALQQAVMAQAAARAHPGRYRALGESANLDDDVDLEESLHR